MLTRRRFLLEPIFTDLNKQAFLELWQRLLVELAEIKNTQFEFMFEDIIINYDERADMKKWSKKKKLKHENKVLACNHTGFQA